MKKALLLIGLATMVAVSTQAVWVMDDMDTPAAGQYTAYSPGGSSSVNVGGDVFGGWRTIKWGTQTGTGLAEVSINEANSQFILDYRQAASVNTVMSLVYDANGAGLNMNLSNMGDFGLTGVLVDQGAFTINYSIMDGVNTLANGSWNAAPGGPYDLLVNFGFQPTWTSADALIFEFVPVNAGADIQIDGVVPEPSSALVIAGLLGLGAVVRRFTK
ncbi:MAG: hypothetical protein KA118_14955 [Verrucomicrobia bacterium]|nr:hypothetical protein [Verrucomicrobiota bacterium]